MSEEKRRIKKQLIVDLLTGIVILGALFGFIFILLKGETGESAVGIFLLIAVILIFAKLSSLVEHFGQPAVLGELIIGVILGNLILLNIDIFEPIRNNTILAFLSELGVVILLFQIGLESNIRQMEKVGIRAFSVACVGVVAPFVLAVYILCPLLLPEASINTYLFLGATLTATSVGITARVFKDLNKIHIPEAQIVLGAAVIDDVLGLIILAIVSAIVTIGAVNIGIITWIVAKSLIFLIGAIVVGQMIAPKLSKFLSQIQDGIGMKFTFAIVLCLIFAFLAQKIGLAPIVGAFAAGLLLDPIHFINFQSSKIITDLKRALAGIDVDNVAKKRIIGIVEYHKNRHLIDTVKPLVYFLVPIFFVMTGFAVRLETFYNPSIFLLALGITAIAFIGKIVSGLAAGKVNKKIVGIGMIPRGEVGLIFAIMGKSLGVFSDELFSAIIIMIILSTLLTPPILSYLIRKEDELKSLTIG
jgi:Kef-type K+ transport system membrane component KefB